MRKFVYLALSLAWGLSACVCASSPANDWIQYWIAGVELSKNRNDYSEALRAYTAAIKAQVMSQLPPHLYLYNERGKLYLKMQAFEQAIQDFSFVLTHQEASKEEIMDALWGRGQAYLASGKVQEFESDRKRLDEIEPFVTPLENNQDYLILKMGSHVWRDTQNQERFIKILLMQKKINSKQDVIFSPSGLAIVKKAKAS